MSFLSRFFIFAAIALVLGLGSAWRDGQSRLFRHGEPLRPVGVLVPRGHRRRRPLHARPCRAAGRPARYSREHHGLHRDAGQRGLASFRRLHLRNSRHRGASPCGGTSPPSSPTGRSCPARPGDRAFPAPTSSRAPDGRFTVRLSPDVQPGNWIPAARGTRVTLRLSILRPLSPDSLLKSGGDILPEITLMECS